MILSIIIPVFNVGNYLEKCIKSIIEQHFENYEIILIDDGSTDNSGDMCDKYAKRYPFILVEHIENGGPSRARNRGIEIATGEYIQFVDADDSMKNDLLLTMAQAVQEYGHPEMIVYEAEVLDENDRVIGDERLPVSGAVDVKTQLLELNSKTKSCLLHYIWNRWYRRDTIVKYCLRFDTSIYLGEDFVFNSSYLRHCDQLILCRKALYNYYKRGGESLTKRFRPNELERRRTMFATMCDLYQAHGILEPCKDILECMEAAIAMSSMKSVNFKTCTFSFQEKKQFLHEFMTSEYENYIRKAVEKKSMTYFNQLCAKMLLRHCYGLYLLLIRLHG